MFDLIFAFTLLSLGIGLYTDEPITKLICYISAIIFFIGTFVVV